MAIDGTAEFVSKSVHIVGMARSGMAAMKALNNIGASVTMHDKKESEELDEQITACKALDIPYETGVDAYKGIESADYVVISPGVPLSSEAIVTADKLGIPVIPEIELAYRMSRAPIVAITGTNGKTTTTALTGAMLKSAYQKTFIAGNIVAGDLRLPLIEAAAEASERDIIIAEISSFQLERTTTFQPKIGVLINIGSDHLDRHPDIQTYAAMKARLFKYQSSDDYALLNADDPVVMSFKNNIKSKIVLFSTKNKLKDGFYYRDGLIINAESGKEMIICNTASLKLRGLHNIENALAACASAFIMGAAAESIQDALNEFAPLEHRLEPVAVINGVEFLNNSMCTNVEASISSLAAIGRPTIVIAGGKDKGNDYTELGAAFNKYSKFVVLIGIDGYMIEDAAHRAGFFNTEKADSLKHAVEIAWKHAVSGDTIVLSPGCASFDMFKSFEDRGSQFKNIVKEIAEKLSG